MHTNFFEIPGYSNYLINKDGQVINRNKNKFLKGSVNPAGYVLFRITDDTGCTLTWGRHRLLGYVFLNPGKDISGLVINHKNAIKGDDRLENLEWVTYRENAEHAGSLGITSRCTPIAVRDVKTGEIDFYPSIVAAANSFGMTKDAINWRIKQPQERVYPEGKQYRAGISNDPWVSPNFNKFGRATPVIVYDVLLGKNLFFEKLSDAANFQKISLVTAYGKVISPNQPLINNRFLIKYADDSRPWREVRDEELNDDFSLVKKKVEVFCLASNKTEIYRSVTDAANAIGLKKSTACSRLKTKPGIIFPDGYALRYVLDSSGPHEL